MSARHWLKLIQHLRPRNMTHKEYQDRHLYRPISDSEAEKKKDRIWIAIAIALILLGGMADALTQEPEKVVRTR